MGDFDNALANFQAAEQQAKDIGMPAMTGLMLQDELGRLRPELTVILITGHNGRGNAGANSMRRGNAMPGAGAGHATASLGYPSIDGRRGNRHRKPDIPPEIEYTSLPWGPYLVSVKDMGDR